MRIALNTKRMTAILAGHYEHSPATLADWEGSLQTLPDGNVVLGWGQQPYISEDAPSGGQIYSARFTATNSSYRAYRFQWSGAPDDRPAVAATSSGGGTTVYVSWNGATRVASWRVLGGAGPSSLRALRTAARTGFETQIAVPRSPYVQVQALDSSGRLLRSCAVTRAS